MRSNADILDRHHDALMLAATEPAATPADGAEYIYKDDEFELTAFGGQLSLGMWSIKFTAVYTGDWWVYSPIEAINRDYGGAVSISRMPRAYSGLDDEIAAAIIERIDAIWPDIEAAATAAALADEEI